MDPFIPLIATHNPHRYHLTVERRLTVGRPDRLFLFGGVGLAAAIDAMQRATGRPVIWATAQYLSFARPGSVVDFDVWVPSKGRFNSQARVIGHVGEQEIITVNAALGERQDSAGGQWVAAPSAPLPLSCPQVRHMRERPEDLNSSLEKRWISGRFPLDEQSYDGTPGEGRLLLWVRGAHGQSVDAALLAVIADLASEALGDALGRPAGGNSLDNTIRYVASAPTDWVLCDFRIEAVHAGTAQTSTHLFAEDGALLAIASQSLIVRYHDDRQA